MFFVVFVCRKMKVAKLAWVSAQIHCQCSVSENRVVLPADSTQIKASEIAVSSSDTSFVPFRGVQWILLYHYGGWFNCYIYAQVNKLIDVSSGIAQPHSLTDCWLQCIPVFTCSAVYLCTGEKGSTVLATKPTILVCDLTLLPGDSQTC